MSDITRVSKTATGFKMIIKADDKRSYRIIYISTGQFTGLYTVYGPIGDKSAGNRIGRIMYSSTNILSAISMIISTANKLDDN